MTGDSGSNLSLIREKKSAREESVSHFIQRKNDVINESIYLC